MSCLQPQKCFPFKGLLTSSRGIIPSSQRGGGRGVVPYVAEGRGVPQVVQHYHGNITPSPARHCCQVMGLAAVYQLGLDTRSLGDDDRATSVQEQGA